MCTGPWDLPWHCKKESARYDATGSLHEGDRARGEVHGMPQCAAVKGNIYLEMLRKSCLGSRSTWVGCFCIGSCKEFWAIWATENWLHSENDPREVFGKILVWNHSGKYRRTIRTHHQPVWMRRGRAEAGERGRVTVVGASCLQDRKTRVSMRTDHVN